LFELLKHVEELTGTIYIPGGVAMVLIILPLLGYGRMRKFGHAVGVVVIGGLVISSAVLLVMALIDDYRKVDLKKKFADAKVSASRAIQLATLGIPPEGPQQLLWRDPLTRGQELFGRHCAGCHRYGELFKDGAEASDLAGFGGENWIMGLLKNPRDPRFLGHTELTRMADWVEEDLAPMNADEADLRRVAAWLATHPRTAPAEGAPAESVRAYELYSETFECIGCHKFAGVGGTSRAPDFTGYGGADWIRGMIMAPDHRSRYGKDNAMPIFLDLQGPDIEIVKEQAVDRKPSVANLSEVDRELIIRWMTNDLRPVYGGSPISTPAPPGH
jgi:mono/diheme cytochrome c family protein